MGSAPSVFAESVPALSGTVLLLRTGIGTAIRQWAGLSAADGTPAFNGAASAVVFGVISLLTGGWVASAA